MRRKTIFKKFRLQLFLVKTQKIDSHSLPPTMLLDNPLLNWHITQRGYFDGNSWIISSKRLRIFVQTANHNKTLCTCLSKKNNTLLRHKININYTDLYNLFLQETASTTLYALIFNISSSFPSLPSV